MCRQTKKNLGNSKLLRVEHRVHVENLTNEMEHENHETVKCERLGVNTLNP